MRRVLLLATAVAGISLSLASCDSVTEGPPASYEGNRPFSFVTITMSFAPDIQWVGGRAAAVGINRGDSAALDSSLVWMAMASGNEIDPPARVRERLDADAVASFGGIPLDSLDDGETYTIWIADQAALDAGLTGNLDAYSFLDSTITLRYSFRGRSGGDDDLDVSFKVVRDQTLTSDQYLAFWEPSTIAFSQVALRRAGTGGFTNLLWHMVQEEDGPEIFYPPLVIGQAPPGAQTVVAWPEGGGFTPPATNYTLWMTRNNWTESFSSSATGYSFFQIFSANF